MARRNDHSRQELKEIAISTGVELMASDGMSDFSARKLARRIGYSVGTLYNIFETYDNLILHINAVTLDELKDHLVASASENTAADARVLALSLHYLRFAEQHYHRWNALFEHTLAPDVALDAWYAEKIAGLFGLIEASLEPYLSDVAARKSNAQILWATIHGICQLGITGKMSLLEGQTSEPLEVLIDRFVTTYLAGIKSHSAD